MNLMRLIVWLFPISVACLANPVTAQTQVLARIGLSKGWATFGQALPQGAVRGTVLVGNTLTQTDVKTRWPDGSIRFAVLTAKVTATDTFSLVAAKANSGGFVSTVPTSQVRFVIAGTTWTASLPATPSTDVWLSGPLVKEWRSVVSPTNPDGMSHPFLRVILDCRSYVDGKSRLDVTVENVLDVKGATEVVYDVDVTVDGATVFSKSNIIHPWLTRWRKLFNLGVELSQITPDFEPFYAAKALPRYQSSITDSVGSPEGPRFDILQIGALHNPMNDVGWRPEIAPYPDWAARYLVHKNSVQRQFVLANGDLGGSWPVHIREIDGRLVSIDERPNFWLDGRCEKWPDPNSSCPRGTPKVRSPWRPDIAHQPSIAYVPYLITGDRYYADEMKFWANYVLIGTWQSLSYDTRRGAQGLLKPNETRGIAWGLRNLVDASSYLPDSDAARAYLVEKVINNLAWLDDLSRSPGPLGIAWASTRRDVYPNIRASLWEHNYLAWAIDHANKQGFQGGTQYRDQIAKFQVRLFNSGPDFPREYAAPYELRVGHQTNKGNQYFSTLSEVFTLTYGTPPRAPTQFMGYYGVDARLMLIIGVESNWPGAQQAYDYLHPLIAVNKFVSGVSDLANRAGWALDIDVPVTADKPTSKWRQRWSNP